MNIEIPANKRRVPVALIFSLAAVLIAYQMIDENTQQPSLYYYLPLPIAIFIYGIVLSIISFIDYVKTLFDPNAKLTISDAGVNDRLSIFSCGMIPWEDISGVEMMKAFKSAFIVLKLADNDKYVKDRNLVKRAVLKRYVKRYGGPVIISEKRIRYNLQELKQIIVEHKQ